MPDGSQCPGFQLDMKENLIAYCIPPHIVKAFDLRNMKRPQGKEPEIIASYETKVEILKRELVRVHITIGRTKNVKDRPRPQDYWVALDKVEIGVWYGHLVPRADLEKEGKFAVPVGTTSSGSRVIPPGKIVNGDRGGDPAESYDRSMEDRLKRLDDLIKDVGAGSKMYGSGLAYPTETATVITSNDGISRSALRVESGAVYADESGRNGSYNVKGGVDRFDKFVCTKCEAGLQPEDPVDPLIQQFQEENK
jgi:hypothetical protein